MSKVFSKLTELSPSMWAILAALLILGAVFFAVSRDSKRWSTRLLANAAMCIALAFLLSCIRLYRMPQGGSITPASMLPLMLFAYSYGTAPGLLAGFTYGMLHFFQGGYFVHPVELLLDYPLAYAMLGLAGLARDRKGTAPLVLSMIAAAAARFFCAFLAGVIFFGEYAPEGQNVFVYSAVYNGFYLIPETLICIVIAMIPATRGLVRRLSFAEARR